MRIPLLAVVLAAVTCGCAHVSRIDVLAEGYRKDLRSAKSAEPLEKSSPTEAESRYREILGRVVIYKPQGDYRREFAGDMSNAANDSPNASLPSGFTDDSPLALPTVYDQAVEAQARAQLGLARLALAKGNADEAQSWAAKALALAVRRALSPVVASELQASCREVLAAIYLKRGEPGKARLAKLDEALARGYLASKAGEAARAHDAEAADADAKSIESIDAAVAGINAARDQTLTAIYVQALFTAAKMAAALQQDRLDAGYVRGGSALTQASRLALGLERQTTALGIATPGGAADSVLSAVANPMMGRQLLDPDFGSQAPSLIKLAVTEIADLSGNETFKKNAAAVGDAVDGVVAARGRPQELGKALGRFADSYAKFQSDADAVTAAPKP